MTAPARPASWELPPLDAAAVDRSRLWEYVAIRATGVLLSLLVLGHFAVTHFVTDVAHDNSSFVARRLSSALWIAWDSTMLAAALVHGAVGVRIALRDYSISLRGRRITTRVLAAVVLVFFAVGVVAIARSAHV
jgi:succinate dehydrogenase / fumarate reductase membrane anchor subunit